MLDQPAKFVISLDFELMWGVRDHADIRSYGANVLGGREAIPRMLDLFERFSIRATWATVGFLFCESKEELLASVPPLQPTYAEKKLSNYGYIGEIGNDEKSDPYYFGLSRLKLVQACPGQEIATHTFSHYYCLERGQTPEQFAADLDAAIAVAERRGVALQSIVFPRNQYGEAHLSIVHSRGLRVFRGNERSWLYRPSSGSEQSQLRRAGRLLDQYVNLSGKHVHRPKVEAGLTDVASSRFLRPFTPRLARLDNLRLHRIKRAIDSAARQGRVFHLWWHPHNFGLNTGENLTFLTAILGHFAEARDKHGLQSACMGDFA